MPTAGGSAPAKVTIELVNESTDGAERAKKEAEAEAKRTQNALPSWIERSTITGELTSAGAAQTSGKAGDETLAVDVGPTSPTKAAGAVDDGTDAYYANLAAAQAAAAAAAQARDADSKGSPTGSALPNGSRLGDSGYEELGDTFSRSASPAVASHTSGSASKSNKNRQKKPKHKRTESLRPPGTHSLESMPSAASSLGKRSRAPSEDSEGSKKSRTVDNTPTPSGAGTPALAQSISMSKSPPLVGFEVDIKPKEEEPEPTFNEEAEDAGDDPILTGEPLSMVLIIRD